MFFCFLFLMLRRSPISTLFPYTTLFRSFPFFLVFFWILLFVRLLFEGAVCRTSNREASRRVDDTGCLFLDFEGDRKSTRLNSSHRCISYAVFCLKKKNHK